MLLDHIRTDHPEISVVGNSMPKKASNEIITDANRQKTTEDDIENLAKQTGISSRKISTMAGIAGISKDELASAARKLSEISDNKLAANDSRNNVVYKRRFVVKPQDTKVSGSKCKLHHYRTSIKSYCQEDGVIFCPSCGTMRQPTKKLRSQITNPCFSPCILNCWPLCVLPCISTTDDTKLYLYCASCNTFLGLYNCKTNSIRPNKNYVVD